MPRPATAPHTTVSVRRPRSIRRNREDWRIVRQRPHHHGADDDPGVNREARDLGLRAIERMSEHLTADAADRLDDLVRRDTLGLDGRYIDARLESALRAGLLEAGDTGRTPPSSR